MQPLLLPLPRSGPAGRQALRTGVEHAVRAAARRGLDQLRDGERELLQHRRGSVNGGGLEKCLPQQHLPAFGSRVGRRGPRGSPLRLACLHCSTPE